MENEKQLSRLREAKSRFGKELLDHPDIHGIGIGYKRKGDEKTRDLAIVVHVYRKRPIEEIDESRRIRNSLSFFSNREDKEVTVPIDIQEKVPPREELDCPDCSTDFTARTRPVPGGFSIFPEDEYNAGTLGGYVWDLENDHVVFLSNEHVLGSTSGTIIIQPGEYDGGSSPADDLAEVVRAGTLDAAIAEVTDSEDQELEIECIGPAVYEITDPELEMEVQKVGRTTGLTCGIVELIDYNSTKNNNDIWIDGDGNDFSQGGDSGSLYVEKNPPEDQEWKRIIGLHWGGAGNDGVGHPIREVFNDLNLTTLCDGAVNALIEAIFGADDETVAEETLGQTTAISTKRCHPGPTTNKGKRAGFYHGIARDFEKRIRDTGTGSQVLKLLRSHRADVVNTLLDGDGWRATVHALSPILCGKVTTDDILDHTLTASDIERFKKAMRTVSRLRPNISPLLKFGEKLLDKAEGKTLSSVLGSSK